MRYMPLSASCNEMYREPYVCEDHREPLLKRLVQKRNFRIALLTCIAFIVLLLAIRNSIAIELGHETSIAEQRVESDRSSATIEPDQVEAISIDEEKQPDVMEKEHESKVVFHFEPLSALKVAKAAESYRAQEKEVNHHSSELDNIELIQLKNSDPLPNRIFADVDAAEMCETGRAECVQPFAKIRPLIVASPRHHLMSCLIQKTMSTVMSAIFCFLVREKEFIDAGRSILREYPDIRLCEGKNEYKSVKDMKSQLHLHDSTLDKWRFSMVTREPVDRFLSGFIDRCIRVGDPCFGCGHNMTCFLEQEYKRAEEYAFADKSGLSRPKITMEDIHVFPQNWRCDMDAYYDKYHFIRYSNDPKDTLLEDLTLLLRSQNVTESAISYISESLRSGRTAHSTVKSAARVFLEERIRQSPYLMELIVRLFYYDYKLLHYPLPDLDHISKQDVL